MLLAKAALFVHIVFAIILFVGVIGGHVLGEMARRAPDLDRRRAVVALEAPFGVMTAAAVPLTIVTGLATMVLFGYSVTDLWILATGAVIVVLVAFQVLFWNKVGPQVHDALGRGDDAVAVRLMRDPRAVVIGRIGVGLAFMIVALMVFRPVWPTP